MPGSLTWGWDPTNKVWLPLVVNDAGKLEIASVEDAEISQPTPEDMKHVPHGYYAAGPSYLPLKVKADGTLQVDIASLAHLNDIVDVNAPTPADGDALTWDDATSKWVPAAAAAFACANLAACALNNIGDVNVPTPTDGDFIEWDSATSKWIKIAHKDAATGVHGVGASYVSLAPAASHLVRTFTKGWTADKLLQGAGVNADPVEIDPPGYTQGARVYHNAHQSIGNTSWVVLAFNSEDYDTDTIHDLVTNNSRLTCKTAGKYIVGATLIWAGNATGQRRCLVETTGFVAWADVTSDAPGANMFSQTIVTMLDMAVNDYVFLEVWQDSGGALNVQGGETAATHFWMQRIG